MPDEPEDDSLELDFTADLDSRSEVYEYSAGTIIFPHGTDVFANEVGALAIRIPDKTGEIEILEAVGSPWRHVSKPERVPERTASVRNIKPA